MVKILECANVWFSRFSTLKLLSAVNCTEFAMRSAFERARSIAQVSYGEQCEFTANSMQFFTLKSGNLKNQTYAHSRILSIWLSFLPFNIWKIKRSVNALYQKI